MPASAVALIALLLAGIGILAPPRVVFALLISVTMLIPASLGMPASGTPALTVTRLILLGAVVGLLVRYRRGGLSPNAFRRTPVHLAWAAYLCVVLVAGLWLGGLDVPLQSSLLRLADLCDQLVFFVVCLALARSVDLRVGPVSLLAATGAASLIMVAEHVTKLAWGHFLFSRLPAQVGTDASRTLALRGGGVRVRGGSEFPLEAGWVLAALLPLLMVSASFSRRIAPRAAVVVALAVVAEVFTVSRSALIGIAVAVVLVLVVSRAPAVLALAAGLAVSGVVAVLADPALMQKFSVAVDTGSIDVRGQRLPGILASAAAHPWSGLGLGGLSASGVPTTDASFLLVYAELGAIGVTVLVVLVATALGTMSRGFRCRQTVPRAVSGASLAGVVVLVGGSYAFDGLQVLQSARLLWLLVALSIAATERELGLTPLPSLPRPVQLAPAAALAGIGLVVFATAPRHEAQQSQLLTVPAFREAGPYDPVTAAMPVINDACRLIDIRAETLPARIDCRNLVMAAGVGEVRIQASTAAAVEQATNDLLAELHGPGRLTFAQFDPETGIDRGVDTPLKTAPVWAGILGLGALLIPSRRRRSGYEIPEPAPEVMFPQALRPAVSA